MANKIKAIQVRNAKTGEDIVPKTYLQTGLPEYEVANNCAELETSVADLVHVLDISDGKFNIHGDCWFQKTDLPFTDGQYSHSSAYVKRTSDNAVMIACENQVPTPPPNAPVVSLGDCIASYVRTADDLIYGNGYGLFDDDCMHEIDCSTFTNAVLDGITYEHSRYVLGSLADNIYGDYIGDNYLPENTDAINPRKHALKAIRMAEWFGQQKRLFKFKASGDYREDIHKLRYGDVLFYGTPTYDEQGNRSGSYADAAYFIDHCAIVLKVFDDGNVLIAQGGGDGIGNNAVKHFQIATDFVTTSGNRYLPTCKLSVFPLKDFIGDRCCVFARPNYGGLGEHIENIPVTVNNYIGTRSSDGIRTIARITADGYLEPGASYTLILKGTLPNGTDHKFMVYATKNDSIVQRVIYTAGITNNGYIAIPFVIAPVVDQVTGIRVSDYQASSGSDDFHIDAAALVRGYAETAELTDAIAIAEAENYEDVADQLEAQVVETMRSNSVRKGRMSVSFPGSGTARVLTSIDWKVCKRNSTRYLIGIMGSTGNISGSGIKREIIAGSSSPSDTLYTTDNPIPFEYVY